MKNGLVSRPIPLAISFAYSASLIATKAAPSPIARKSQWREDRGSPARAAAVPRAAAHPLVTSTIVFSPARRESSTACPDANTAGLTARATENAPRKRPNAASSLKMSNPYHGIAGQVIEEAPAGLLLFVIRCRHLVSG